MLNKPRGLITAKTDKTRPTVMECFPEDLKIRLHPVGRLDMDTEGLLIFTDDGTLDNKISHPDRHVRKKYFLYAFGHLGNEQISKLENGVEISTGVVSKPAKVEYLGSAVISEVSDKLIENGKKKRYLSRPQNPVFSIYITISEGKKHQVKKMLKAVGCHVFYLKRVKVGGLELDPELAPGQYRLLTDAEIKLLTEDHTQ